MSARDLSVWDVAAHGWKEVGGAYNVAVCASSRDLRQSIALDNQAGW